VTIAVAIYLPNGAGRYPTLFAASPYRFDNNLLPPTPQFLWRETGPIKWYLDHGYAFVSAPPASTRMPPARCLDICDVGHGARHAFRAAQQERHQPPECSAAWCQKAACTAGPATCRRSRI
jgi:X-Pro dipeptidyl-peptidase (S15 family)